MFWFYWLKTEKLSSIHFYAILEGKQNVAYIICTCRTTTRLILNDMHPQCNSYQFVKALYIKCVVVAGGAVVVYLNSSKATPLLGPLFIYLLNCFDLI